MSSPVSSSTSTIKSSHSTCITHPIDTLGGDKLYTLKKTCPVRSFNIYFVSTFVLYSDSIKHGLLRFRFASCLPLLSSPNTTVRISSTDTSVHDLSFKLSTISCSAHIAISSSCSSPPSTTSFVRSTGVPSPSCHSLLLLLIVTHTSFDLRRISL